MSAPLSYTEQIISTAEQVAAKGHQLQALADQVMRSGTNLEAGTAGQFSAAGFQAVTAWKRDFDPELATADAWVREAKESYYAMRAVDQRGAGFFGG